MAENGVQTNNVTKATLVDEVLGNREGSTVAIKVSDLLKLMPGEINGPVYETLAELSVDLAHEAGVVGLVWRDSDSENDGLYQKAGDAGEGTWERYGDITMNAALLSMIADIADQFGSMEEAINQSAAAAENASMSETLAANAAASASSSALSTELLSTTVATLRDQTEALRDSALLGAVGIYDTTSLGIAATSDQDLFLVKGSENEAFADLYLNDNGTAVFQDKTMPTKSALEALGQEYDETSLKEYALGVADVTEARIIPIAKKNGRTVTTTEDGEVLETQGVGELRGILLNELMFWDGSEVVKAVADEDEYITELWTKDGRYFIASENGLKEVSGGSLDDAPSDGTMYARKDGEWVEVEVSSGSVQSDPAEVGDYTLSWPENPYSGISQGMSYDNFDEYLYMFLLFGQSNQSGQNNFSGRYATTAIYPNNALMFSQTYYQGNSSRPSGPLRRTTDPIATTEPLVEGTYYSFYADTAASGWANHFISDVEALTGEKPTVLISVCAEGAKNFGRLKRGGQYWDHMLASVRDGMVVAENMGRKLRVLAISLNQGEAEAGGDSDYDASSGNGLHLVTEQRRITQLRKWARDAEEDIRRITGQEQRIPFFVDQIAPQAQGYDIGPWQQEVAQAQWKCHGIDMIRFVQPMYHLPRDNNAANDSPGNIHASALGHNYRGQALARATILETFGEGWVPVIPTGEWEWNSSTEIDIHFDAQTYPLVLDTSGDMVTVDGDYPLGAGLGFIFEDDSGSPPTITGVSVVNEAWVRITLSAAPTGLNPRVGYATDCPSTGFGPVEGGRGCLRDSTSHTSLYDSSVQHNWCPAFIMPLKG